MSAEDTATCVVALTGKTVWVCWCSLAFSASKDTEDQ